MNFNERHIFELLKPYIEKNKVCVDVGANVGAYTEFFLEQLNDTGKVYSIELVPETYQLLSSKYGHQRNIQIINCAASDVDGTVQFYYGVDNTTHNIIGHDCDFNKNELAGEIKSLKIDTILSGENQIRLIKIDVEGSEISVLKGMKETLQKTDFIFLECHLDKDWPEVAEILTEDNDFEIFEITTNTKMTKKDQRPYLSICKNKKKQ